jgi:hypothetical protein
MGAKLILEPGRIASMTAIPEGRRDLAARSHAYPQAIRRRWKRLKKATAVNVLTVDDLHPYFSLLLSLADISLHAVQATRNALDAAGEPSDLPALDRTIESLKSLRAEISDVWQWLDAPFDPPPIRSTEEIRSGLAWGEYINADEASKEAIRNLPGTP